MFIQDSAEAPFHPLPRIGGVALRFCSYAQTHFRRRDLDKLETLQPRRIVNFERQGRQGHFLAAAIDKFQPIGGTALHADSGKRISARTWIRPDEDAVAKVVSQDGLDAICQITDQNGV